MHEIKRIKPLAFWGYYDQGELPAAWVKSIVMRPVHTFEVPTEMVLCPADKNAWLQQGRVWYADDELGRDRGADGTWESCRYIIEVMEDTGDDGHIGYACMGWALVTSRMLHEYLCATRACRDRHEFPRWEVE